MKNTLSISAVLLAGATLCGALAAGIAAPSAVAEPSPPATSDFNFKFNYSQADLANDKAAQHLLTRLRHEVRVHCGAEDGRLPIDMQRQVKACVEATMRNTIEHVGSPTLAEAWQSRASQG